MVADAPLLWYPISAGPVAVATIAAAIYLGRTRRPVWLIWASVAIGATTIVVLTMVAFIWAENHLTG